MIILVQEEQKIFEFHTLYPQKTIIKAIKITKLDVKKSEIIRKIHDDPNLSQIKSVQLILVKLNDLVEFYFLRLLVLNKVAPRHFALYIEHIAALMMKSR